MLGLSELSPPAQLIHRPLLLYAPWEKLWTGILPLNLTLPTEVTWSEDTFGSGIAFDLAFF